MKQKGDTLWSIAEKYSKNTDIRQYIYDLKKLNDMEQSSLYSPLGSQSSI